MNTQHIPTINKLSAAILISTLGMSQITHAAETADAQNNSIKQINHIQWHKSGSTPIQTIKANQLPANETNLIFIRPMDNDPLQTSANIAIDGRFQVSLQPGHYSQLRYCSGEHSISVAPTGMKSNDLNTLYQHIVELAPQQNHYIHVDIDDTTAQPRLSTLTDEQAKQLLTDKKQQTHQISRVVRNCPEIQPEPEPEPIKVEIDKPINLKVLFEFDKAIVQPVFNRRIEAVANFMKKYPDTTTVIEGHTDSQGPDKYNMGLSQRRAQAVKQELVTKYGIAPQRLSTVGYGETRPVDTNATKEGRYNNRRVVATVSADK